MSADTVTVPDSIRELADLRRRVMVGTEAQRSAALHEYLSALIDHSRAKITELTAERDVLRVRVAAAMAVPDSGFDPDDQESIREADAYNAALARMRRVLTDTQPAIEPGATS